MRFIQYIHPLFEKFKKEFADSAGAQYKIPLGIKQGGPIKDEKLNDAFILVDINDEGEEDSFMESFYKVSFTFYKDRNDKKGTMDIQGTMASYAHYFFSSFQQTLEDFKKSVDEIKGLTFEIKESGKVYQQRLSLYKKIFKRIFPNGKLSKDRGIFIWNIP